jgi:hypothetical protein
MRSASPDGPQLADSPTAMTFWAKLSCARCSTRQTVDLPAKHLGCQPFFFATTPCYTLA